MNKLDDNLLIKTLRCSIDSALRPRLSEFKEVALIDFPNHSNVGDSAIYLGERAYLKSIGIKICYSCDSLTYSQKKLKQSVANNPILLHGGGNLGTLWPEYQYLKEQVVKDFPHNPIIQLPQTIYFQRKEAMLQARDIFQKHQNFFVFVRDQKSYNFATKDLNVSSALCPDLAFFQDPLRRCIDHKYDVFWLSRTDQESTHLSPNLSVLSKTCRADWLTEQETFYLRINRKLAKLLASFPYHQPVLQMALLASYDRLAQLRVERGCKLLSSGKLVIADRLHAHILCILLGIPHFVIDNNYGKLKSFYDSWTKDSSLTHWCDSSEEAWSQAFNYNL